MTILELQTANSGEIVTNIISTLAADTSLSESDRAAFSRLNADGYGKIIDDSLSTMYGQNELRDSVLSTYLLRPFWQVNISAYLRRRVEYFKKCFMYIDAEYDPVENYMGSEVEVVTENKGARSESGSDTVGSQSNSKQYGAASNSYTHGAHNDSVVADVTTERRKTSPEDTSTFYDTEETTAGGAVNGSGAIQPHTTENRFAQQQDSESIGAHIDGETIGGRSDSHTRTAAAYIDTMRREFTRHGNIGVLSSGELFEKDAAFWSAFGWLYDTTHDISNLISKAVWAL